MERHEIPEPQAKRLAEIRSRVEDVMAEKIRAESQMYRAMMTEARVKEEMGGAVKLVAEFIDIDLNKGYRLTADCKAFVLGEPE